MDFKKFLRISLFVLMLAFVLGLAGCSADGMIISKGKAWIVRQLESFNLDTLALGIMTVIAGFAKNQADKNIKNERLRVLADQGIASAEKKGRDLLFNLLTSAREKVVAQIEKIDPNKPLKGQVETWLSDKINEIKKAEAVHEVTTTAAGENTKLKPAEIETAVESRVSMAKAPALLAENASPVNVPEPEFRSPEARRLVAELRERIKK